MPPSRAVLHLLPVATWRKLLATFDVAVPKSVRDIDALTLFLADAKLTPAAARALSTVSVLTTREAGRDLVHCARAHSYDCGPDEQTPAERAARLVVDATKNELARLVAKRAPLHGERRAPPTPTREYLLAGDVGDLDVSPRALALLAKDIDAAVGAKTKSTDVLYVPRKDGFGLDILRPGAIEAGLTQSKGKIVTTSHRQIAGDVVTWVSARKRLRIATSDPALAGILRAKIGLRCFGSERAFSDGPSVKLSPFRLLGKRALDATAFGASFTKARLVRVVWDWGGDDVVLVRGRDVLASIAARGWSLATGHFVGAVLRLDLTHGGHVDVVLKPPHRVHWTPGPWDDAVAAWLDAGPFLALGADRVDAWTHFAATMRDTEWRAEYGDEWVEKRKASGALVAAETRVLPHPQFASAPRALLAFYDDEDGGYAFAEDDDDDVPAMVVTRSDLGARKIDAQKYAEEIGRYLDAVLPPTVARAPQAVDAQRGFFDFGERSFGGETMKPFVALGPIVEEALKRRLGELASNARAVLLLPRGRTLGTGHFEAAWPESEEEARELVREIARRIGGSAAVSVVLVAPEGTRFAIDSVSREAWLDGVALELTDQPFDFLLLLGKTPRVVVSTEAVNVVVGRMRRDAEAAKQAKAALLKQIRAAFVREGREPPSDLAELVTVGSQGGYRLNASAYVR